MDDIARDMGMSKKTLYQLVENKTDLIEKVIELDMSCDKLEVEKAKLESTDALHEMLHVVGYFSRVMREQSPAAMYDLQKYYRPLWERIDKHHYSDMIVTVHANLQRGMEEGLYRSDLDAEIIGLLFLNGPKTFLDLDRIEVESSRWPHVLMQFMRYHLYGVCSDHGREVLEQHLRNLNLPQP